VSPQARATSKSRSKPRTRKPKPLRKLTRKQWERIGRAAYARFGDVELTDRAAALAYYGFLSLFPALIVAIALLALFGSYPETYNSIIDTLREAAPGTAVDTIDSALRDVLRGQGAGGLLGIGLVLAFVTASGAVGASIRALEAINQTRKSASFVRSNLTRLWLTLALMALLLVAVTALLVAGPLFGTIAESAGLGDFGRILVQVLRYPVGIGALMAAILLLYTLGPAGTRRRPIEHLPGALLAALLWVIASVGFSFYVSNFGSYDKTYGTLGTVIVLMVWIYVGAVAMLVGALVNREVRRVREKR
jgi:membrane protein